MAAVALGMLEEEEPLVCLDEEPQQDGYVKSYLEAAVKSIDDNETRPSYFIEPKDPAATYCTHAYDYYKPRLHVFSPLSANCHGPIGRCIECGSTNLSHGGWPSNPAARRVVSSSGCYYSTARLVQCKCGKKFSSTNAEFMKSLPPSLVLQYPAYLTKRSGIDLELLHMMRACFSSAFGPNRFSDMLRENHFRRYHETMAKFLWTYDRVNSAGSIATQMGVVEQFSHFGDPKGYAGFVPSPGYLTSVYKSFIQEHDIFFHKDVQKRPVEHLAIDYAHKVFIYRV